MPRELRHFWRCGERFMVLDSVWAEAGDLTGSLCVGCLEARIGRELVPADFMDVPLNDDNDLDSRRLVARKGLGRDSERRLRVAVDRVLAGEPLGDVARNLDLEERMLKVWVSGRRMQMELLAGSGLRVRREGLSYGR